MAEKRVVSETGGEKGQKEARLGGADPRALQELALIYGFGEEKYARYNYLKGYPWSLSVDALFRHLLAFLDGEDLDPESGLHHTAHVAWHALTLTSYQMRKLGTDDRCPQESAPTATPSLTDLWSQELARKNEVAPLYDALGRCKECYRTAPQPWMHTDWCSHHPSHVETPNPWGDA
jgi:hypothetical protein